MESYQKELAQIKTILKDNPKGMTVTDISRELNVNRNSVAKYLDILRVSGHVEMITFGPAKVFFPSRRVPMSVMLNYISDYILIVDRDLRLVQVNDTFLGFINQERGPLLNQRIQDVALPFLNSPEIQSNITNALNGQDPGKEIPFQTSDPEYFFIIKFIPTLLEDGRHAATIVIKNVTEQKIAEKAVHESEEKLQGILKKIHKNKDGKTTWKQS
jgi:PAS domain-containing protein